MEKAFKNLIKSQFPFLCQSKLLLAVSGGVDSVVMAHLCKLAKLDFSIAHCNFNLRGTESDEDETFVIDLADALDVEVFTQAFNTEAYAKEAKLSIQMAARDLRYSWFEELRGSLNFDFILSAHHANDNVETFLINLVRGTGIEGFTGIKDTNGYILRPMLNFSRKEIEAYATQNILQWREDSSNASPKYMRNKIRHNVVPVLEEINPQFLESFSQSQKFLKENVDLVEDYIALLYNEIVEKTHFGYQLKLDILKKLPNNKAVLYQLLKSFGFTEWNDVHALLDAQSGKMVFSRTHRLIKDREHLLLTEIPDADTTKEYQITENEDVVMLPMGTFSFHEVDKVYEVDSNHIFVPKALLEFPLVLRRWQNGDYFYPFGMKGKKKLSDYFKDKKLSLPEKENIWLLCSNNKIVWVVNHRADNRFAVTDPSQKIIKLTYTP